MISLSFLEYHLLFFITKFIASFSWNHAKIVAVDGKYLWTGGHNFWTAHYLTTKPVNDLR